METVEQLQKIFASFPDPEGKPYSLAALKKIAELRHRARTDHFFLANKILDCDFYPDVHDALFDALLQKDPSKSLELQDAVKRRLMLWSRMHYKTTAEVVEIVQLILNFPQITILCVSGTKPLVEQISELVHNAFESNDRMRELFPEYCSAPGKTFGSVNEFSIPLRKKTIKTRGGTFNISTPKSVKSGIHADAVFLDDLQHDKNWQTPSLLEGVQNEYFTFSGPILGEGYLYIFGTRHVPNDLYGFLLNEVITEKGYKPLKTLKTYKITERWSEENQISHDGQWIVSIRSCWKVHSPDDIELLFPQRGPAQDGKMKGHTLEFFLQMQRTKPLEFACHYEQRPIAGGEQTFTEELFTKASIFAAEHLPKRGTTFAVWDTSTGNSERSDLTVGVVARVGAGGRVFIIDCVAGKLNADELNKNIIILHNKWKCHTSYVEILYGNMLLNSVAMYCKLIGIETPDLALIPPCNKKNIKDIRIKALLPLMITGRIAFWAGMAEYENMKKAFLDYGNVVKDDYPDAVSLVIDICPVASLGPSLMEQELTRQAEAEQAAAPEQDSNQFGGIGSFLNG